MPGPGGHHGGPGGPGGGRGPGGHGGFGGGPGGGRPPMGGGRPPMGGGWGHRPPPPRHRGCCGCLLPVIGIVALAVFGLSMLIF